MTTRLIMTREDGSAAINDCVGATFSLSEEDSHYITRVLRLSAGARLIVVNPSSGAELLVALTDTGRTVAVEVLSVTRPSPRYHPVAALLYPLTKGSTIELVLEKACELGVPNIILWQAERSVVRLGDARDQEKKLLRWQKIVRAASQQSEKNWIPSISLHTDLRGALSSLDRSSIPAPVSLVCSLDTGARPIAECVAPGGFYHLAIGPEGDFTPEEMMLLTRDGFIGASLGPYRLRAETAAIAAVAMTVGIAGFSITPTPA